MHSVLLLLYNKDADKGHIMSTIYDAVQDARELVEEELEQENTETLEEDAHDDFLSKVAEKVVKHENI